MARHINFINENFAKSMNFELILHNRNINYINRFPTSTFNTPDY